MESRFVDAGPGRRSHEAYWAFRGSCRSNRWCGGFRDGSRARFGTAETGRAETRHTCSENGAALRRSAGESSMPRRRRYLPNRSNKRGAGMPQQSRRHGHSGDVQARVLWPPLPGLPQQLPVPDCVQRRDKWEWCVPTTLKIVRGSSSHPYLLQPQEPAPGAGRGSRRGASTSCAPPLPFFSCRWFEKALIRGGPGVASSP
jgi:hypothetical protein